LLSSTPQVQDFRAPMIKVFSFPYHLISTWEMLFNLYFLIKRVDPSYIFTKATSCKRYDPKGLKFVRAGLAQPTEYDNVISI